MVESIFIQVIKSHRNFDGGGGVCLCKKWGLQIII